MKKITLITLLTLVLCAPAWAEDIDPYAEAVVAETEQTINTEPAAQEMASQREEAAAALPSTQSDSQPVPALVSHAPQLSRADNAQLHLNLIRDHISSDNDDDFNETTLLDVDLFLSNYRDLSIVADALFSKGKIQYNLGNEEAALVTWLQLIYEYPDSDAAKLSRQRVLALLESDLDQFAQQVQPMLDQKAEGDQAARLLKLINKIYKIEDEDVNAALARLQLDFLRRFPLHEHADEVLILYAHTIATESTESGLYAFKKLLALYPNSLYRPESLLASADLERRLGHYEDATNFYNELIRQYPKHKMVQFAYTNLALTLEKDLDRYQDAITTLNTIVELYPNEKNTLKALQTMAKLQEDETNQPAEAVATLRRLAKMFPKEESAIEALEHAIHLVDKELDDPELYMQVQEQLVTDFPNSEQAPEVLFNMAEFADEKLHDRNRARELYKKFIESYPWHKRASDARLLI